MGGRISEEAPSRRTQSEREGRKGHRALQEEDDAEPVIFGVTTPLHSWNPLWANLQFYAQLWHDARRAGSLWDKLRIWFMPTGWRPAPRIMPAARLPCWKPPVCGAAFASSAPYA